MERQRPCAKHLRSAYPLDLQLVFFSFEGCCVDGLPVNSDRLQHGGFDLDLELTPYSRREAEQAVEQFVSTGWQLRHMILEMYDRKAHRALGFQEFSDFCKDRLGGQWDDTYLSKLRAWATVERELAVKVHNQLTYKGSLTKREAEQFKRLPQDQWAETYRELESFSGSVLVYII